MRKSKVIFIKNALILTTTGLLIRFAGMLFRIWLAGEVGSEGIGLYSQIFSFYMLASAFASTGINTAVTRMVSEELSLGRGRGAALVLTKCAALSISVALLSGIAIFLLAEVIASQIIGDPRAAEALRTLTLSLPFMGLSSCIKGYFIARKKTAPASTSQILEQLVRIGIIALALSHTLKNGLGAACRGIILGDVVAEICSCGYVFVAFLIDNKLHLVCRGGDAPPYSVFSRLRHIALPITTGRYLNSLLRTAENLLVPRGLKAFGMSSVDALSVFGVIKGMVLPLIFFPASFLNALSTLLIPEMSEAAAKGKSYKVKYTAEKCIHITLISSLPVALVFFFCARPLGILVYGEEAAGEMISLLAPLIPLMYLDSVCDGLLKGLDKQTTLFRNSVLDSLGRLVLILLVLPFCGIMGFVGIMYLSNLFTCFMNLHKLIRVSSARVKWFRWLVLPLISGLILATTFDLILVLLPLPSPLFICLFALLTSISYLFVIFRFGCISIEDLR